MFGRRKKGFAKEVIITEFEHEYNEDRVREEEEKVDLIDYINQISDEELESIELDETEEIVEEEKSYVELLADYIRERSLGALLTSKMSLLSEDEKMEEILAALKEDENCKDITTIKGEKDIYYYSLENMSDNYAMIAMLVEEKDLARTIAEMVRWNCKTYPCPTPVYYFKNSPYFYTEDEIEMALNNIKDNKAFEDIGELLTGNKVRYLYSTIHMSERYAKALAESTEYGEYGYI